ncbi:hypothetical protein HMPREF1139_0010 [Campylobacter sp. FOBRC14]|nr:hypothetical protein HMPREF1139_0010 [Campylobacter sp. FOBRC14]
MQIWLKFVLWFWCGRLNLGINLRSFGERDEDKNPHREGVNV